MAKQKYKTGDILNGWKIADGPKKVNGRVKYHFVCPDCGHDKGVLLTCNIQRLKNPCACKVGQSDPISKPKYIKEEDGCFSICHVGLSEHWHKLTLEDGLSQRKAAELIHSSILQFTNGGQQLEEKLTKEKVRSVGRTNTGRKKSAKTATTPKISSSPEQLIETVRQARRSIIGAIEALQDMARKKQLHSPEPFRSMDVEMVALGNLVNQFLQPIESPVADTTGLPEKKEG